MKKLILAAIFVAIVAVPVNAQEVIPLEEAQLFAETAAGEIQKGYAAVSCGDLWALWNNPAVAAARLGAIGEDVLAWQEIRTTFIKVCDMYPFTQSRN